MELEGSLKAFSLPEILQFLAMSKMTGTLSIKQPGNSIDLYILRGRIVNSSTLKREFKLGEMLVYRGLVQRGQLDRTLDQQKAAATTQRLGEMLIEQGLIDRNILKQAIKLQLEEEVWKLFDTDEGDFKFEHHDPDEIDDVVIEIDIEPLLIEGTRRIDEWERISGNIPSSDSVITIAPLPPNWERDISLTENEWKVLSLINGYYTVSSLVRRSCLGKFETYRILNTFLKSRILEILDEEETPRSPCHADNYEVEEEEKTEAPVQERREWTLGSLFGRKENGSTSRKPRHASPLGIWCGFINEYVEGCEKNRDFGDIRLRHWVDAIWRECLNIYPRADLFYTRNNRLRPEIFEKYNRFHNQNDNMQGVYEDAQEALQRLMREITHECFTCIGEKQTRKLLQNVKDAFSSQYREHMNAEYSIDALCGEIDRQEG
ncbi:DUF4388 domain-containing protein [Candidatus Sumerlaeota bacterium]|nr:DUF4388 domain-containing protein [Candidatus Sumerlaeota bacterium]